MSCDESVNRDETIPFDRDQEVVVARIRKIDRTVLALVMASWWIAQSAGWAQTTPPSPARPLDNTLPIPLDRAGPLPLPNQPPLQSGVRGIAPPPASPASILKLETQPIDLTTALNLAGVQNPDLNIARTRISRQSPCDSSPPPIFFHPSIPV